MSRKITFTRHTPSTPSSDASRRTRLVERASSPAAARRRATVSRVSTDARARKDYGFWSLEFESSRRVPVATRARVMSSVKDLIDKALRGVESASSESEEDIASAVPTWGSPARDEPSSAYIRRARGFAARMAREVARDEAEDANGTMDNVDALGRRWTTMEGKEVGEDLSARFGDAAAETSDDALMDELRGNLRPGHPMARKKDGAGGEARRGGGVGARSAREARREAFRGASSKLAASREHFDVVVSALERERRAHGETKSKYEELGAHANVVLRQRDDARASLEASTSRERAASRRVDELSKRLDEERSVSETRLDELRRANETWRATQVTEIDAMRRAAEARMRDAEEAAARVEDRVAERVAHCERRMGEAEREAASRARDAVGRFGALASSTEVRATREANALRAKMQQLEDDVAEARRERSAATRSAETAKREMDDAVGQFESYKAELTSARDVIHARDGELADARRDLRTTRVELDDARSRTRRLESENADLALKVSSLEEVLGDVGGHKRNIMILRGRVTHLTSEIQRAKECTAATKRTVADEIQAVASATMRDAREVIETVQRHYEARLHASSVDRVAELLREVKRLERDIEDLKQSHEAELAAALAAERDSAASASEMSIRSSTQRTIEAEKAKAIAELTARETQERLESMERERDAMEEALSVANERVAALKAERATSEDAHRRLQSRLDESEANVRDLGTLLNKRKSSSDDEDEETRRLQSHSATLAQRLERLERELDDAKAETSAAVKSAEQTAQLEIDALRRGMEMSAHRATSEHEGRVDALERELAEALESKKLANEEVEELREQIGRYQALTKLQDDAMSASKSQVSSLSHRLRSLETSVSGSPMPSSSPSASPGSASKSFFLTPGSFTPLTRPAPTPITAVRSPRSSPRASPRTSTSRTPRTPAASPIKSPLFKGLFAADEDEEM